LPADYAIIRCRSGYFCEVDYPAVVTAGQQFNIKYSVNSGGGELTVPSFDGFYKLMGPQTSYSSYSQYINGRMTQSTSYSYTYVLQALKKVNTQFRPPPSPTRAKHSGPIRFQLRSLAIRVKDHRRLPEPERMRMLHRAEDPDLTFFWTFH